jgi:hypothetical protein
VSEELATCRAELEKQRILTERLENDLMHIERTAGDRLSGASTPAASTDALSSLNLGVPNVSRTHLTLNPLLIFVFRQT